MAQGKINVYVCYKKHRTVTIDRDIGTTPYLIDCPHDDCVSDGTLRFNFASSLMYRVDQSLTPSHEWYKPSGDELNDLSEPEREHVESGGLLLRKIPIT